VLLLPVAMVLFVWGVASPASVSKFFKSTITRKNAAVWFGGMSVLLFVLVGITAPEPAPSANLSGVDQSTAQAKGASTAQAEKPKPTVEIVTEQEPIPFEKTTINNSSMLKGTSQVTTVGVNGVKTITYEITKLSGSVTKKSLVKEEITTQPINEVTSIGTKVAYTAPARAPVVASSPSGSCDPNYAGACVPIASDVDCAGGSGNGPAYVAGPVTVIGNDIYDLDRDGNGYGCE
jgi:hypothetical protein